MLVSYFQGGFACPPDFKNPGGQEYEVTEFIETEQGNHHRLHEQSSHYLRSMEQGAVTKDGYNLAEDLTVYEQEKLKEYIYCMAFDEMKKTVGRHCLNVCDFGSDREDFISNFQIVIMKRLKDFNTNGSAKRIRDMSF